MTIYDDLLASLRHKNGPITLNDVLLLQENQQIPAGVLAPGSVATTLMGGTVAAGVPFSPFQVVWLFALSCDAAGPATVTLTGVRLDTGASETVATYSLSAGETITDANDRTDHARFSWSKTGSGNVTARVS